MIRISVKTIFHSLVVVACLLFASVSNAEPIQWVTVGDPGNANDTSGRGSVNASYRIMSFEFTNSQYAAFLNAIDPAGTNPNSVWSSFMGSNPWGGITNTGTTNGSRYAVKSNMGDKPVNFVSWFDAARVANWLHNGAQTYGSTDASASAPQNTGAYTTGTATSGNAAAKNSGALFYVPTEDEWYKAAYYNPTLNGGSGAYRVYGNGFDTAPGIVSADAFGVGSAGASGNFANYNAGADWNGRDGNVTTVGTNGGASYYGSFDMSGNVREWNDLQGTAAGSSRGIRGGDWIADTTFSLSSSSTENAAPSSESARGGFRLAAPVVVPEPSTYAMALAGLACGGWQMWRRRRLRHTGNG
jgi:sulfatase modifying factor 1